MPNSYIHLICFIAFCHECGVEPSLDFFFVMFTLGRSKELGYRQLNKQPGMDENPFQQQRVTFVLGLHQGPRHLPTPELGEPSKTTFEFRLRPPRPGGRIQSLLLQDPEDGLGPYTCYPTNFGSSTISVRPQI